MGQFCGGKRWELRHLCNRQFRAGGIKKGLAGRAHGGGVETALLIVRTGVGQKQRNFSRAKNLLFLCLLKSELHRDFNVFLTSGVRRMVAALNALFPAIL